MSDEVCEHDKVPRHCWRCLTKALERIRDHEDHDKYCDACVCREAIAEMALTSTRSGEPGK